VGLRNFTGIDSLYEAPQVPDIHVAGLDETPEVTAARIADWSVIHQGEHPDGCETLRDCHSQKTKRRRTKFCAGKFLHSGNFVA
jgi:hypothetical protein